MAGSGIDSGSNLAVKQYDDKAFREYADKLALKELMGTKTESVIQVKENLNKFPGDTDTFALRMNLDSEGIEDDADLEGQEEEMVFHDFSVTASVYKNAVKSKGQLSERRSAFDLKDEAMDALSTWAAQKVENLLFQDMARINGVLYASATEAQKDAWAAANGDARVLYGADVANHTGDNSVDVAKVDATNDVCALTGISLIKRLAQLADPQIRPIKIEGGEEWYVLMLHPYAARDLKASSGWQQAQREAQMRGDSNPIFTGALGAYDGVIIKESKKVPLLSGVGASSINVAMNFLLGAQALVLEHVSLPMRPKSKMVLQEEFFDYQSRWGVAAFMGMAHGKAVFNSKDHGVATWFTAAVAD
jgi:N4-gp56 family major capsid protein